MTSTPRSAASCLHTIDKAERKRLAEPLRTASTNLNAVLGQLDKGWFVDPPGP
jgi:hypothetical protein